jgi:hypothetical protein
MVRSAMAADSSAELAWRFERDDAGRVVKASGTSTMTRTGSPQCMSATSAGSSSYTIRKDGS